MFGSYPLTPVVLGHKSLHSFAFWVLGNAWRHGIATFDNPVEALEPFVLGVAGNWPV